jgi:hypothetical protein
MDMTHTARGERRSAWAATEAETRDLRNLSTRLAIPGLCDARACRRARACRGDPHDCLERYEPLVPDDARAGADALIEARRGGASAGALAGCRCRQSARKAALMRSVGLSAHCFAAEAAQPLKRDRLGSGARRQGIRTGAAIAFPGFHSGASCR